MDVVVTTLEGSVKLFHNITKESGYWLAVRLRGKRSNRDGLGATVAVALADGRTLLGHVTTSVGYASSSEPLVRFGLGSQVEAARIVVRWPGGRTQEVAHVRADRIVEIEEADK